MFNSLASYLLGNSSNRSNTSNNNPNSNQKEVKEQDASPSSADVFETLDLRTTACDEDDDWLLVEREKEDEEGSLPRTDSEEELPFVEIKRAPISSGGHRKSKKLDDHQADDDEEDDEFADHASNLYTPVLLHAVNTTYPSTMEESWFVTPPPCFTSTGPINMEHSPFEDLLIEHPSMSVYHSIRNTSQIVDDDIVVLDLEPATISVSERNHNISRNVRHAERMNSIFARQEMLRKNAQKSHQKKRSMCRSEIERVNKVREVQSSKSGPKRRSDQQHSKTISRANNNRKC